MAPTASPVASPMSRSDQPRFMPRTPPAPRCAWSPARSRRALDPRAAVAASCRWGDDAPRTGADDPPMTSYGEPVRWQPATPRLRLVRTLVAWVVAAASVWVAAAVVPGVALEQTGAAFLVAALLAVLNAILPPVLAALRLPFTLVAGFLLVLLADALLLELAGDILSDDIHVGSFGDALLAALVISAVSVVLQVILGTNDDDQYTLKVTRRIARRQGALSPTDVPGIVFLEIDGLALPVLRDAMRDGSAPWMASQISDGGYRLAEWETD